MPAAAEVDGSDPELVVAAMRHDAAAAVGPWPGSALTIWTRRSSQQDLIECHVRTHASHSVVQLVRARRREAKLPVVAGHDSAGPAWERHRTATRPIERRFGVDSGSQRTGCAQRVLACGWGGATRPNDRTARRH